MERQAHDSEATPRFPRQYQAEVREASVDEAADNDLYGDENQRQPVPWGFEREQAEQGENSQWIADHVTEEPISLVQELHSNDTGHQPLAVTRSNDLVKQEIIYLCDHRGSRCVFPFEQCSSRESTAQLWEEMYRCSDLNPQEKQNYLDKLVNGEYRVQTLDGVSILPSAWRTIVRPNETIKIAFTDPLRSYSRSQLRIQPENTSRLDPGASSSRQDLAVSIEVLGSASSSEESEGSIITEDDSSENATSSDEDDTYLKDYSSLRPNRYVLDPMDAEGNRLSFQVKTERSSSVPTPSEGTESPEGRKEMSAENKGPGDSNLEIRRITKAMATESDVQNMLVLHTLPSLANPRLRASVATTWYHLHGDHLDFGRFENVCLTIPHLSSRLQALTRGILIKLREEKIKPFVGGKFIEPGTVLRADEADPTDSQSVIFSCIPYFSLQQVAKPSPGQGDLLCRPRTLMQALYPYESVRERDEEQSYRKFGSDSNNVVHVPSLWIMNIGSTAVVTYGHEPLSVAMRDSINIVEEDIRHLGKQGITENTLTKVHITDLDGANFVYPINTFRSYFQLESRIVDANSALEGRIFGKGIKLQVQNIDGVVMAGPGTWKDILTRAAHLVSISITISNDQKLDGSKETPESDPEVVSLPMSVPPFFHWLQSKTNHLSLRGGKPVIPGTSEKDRSMVCLEYVEKIMRSRYLVRSNNAVEDAFTSTGYYYFLPESKYEGVSTRLSELQELIKTTSLPVSGSINHKMVIDTQCRGVLTRSVQFLQIVRDTLKLFVDDLDSSSILRKLSGALQNIHQQVVTIEQRGPLEPDPEEYTNSKWEHPDMMKRAWSIRTSAWEVPSTLPDSRKTLQKSILRCSRCRSPFKSATSAMADLVRHVKKYSTGVEHPEGDIPSFQELQDWIINSLQYRRELTNASALVILTHASEISRDLFVRAKELAQGVQNEDGHMSSLYTLPQELINAFRRIVIFYLAIERALHENEKAYGQDVHYQSSRRLTNAPYAWRDADVLKRFGWYARQSLCKARMSFHEMAMPEAPLSLRKHISLGPEYVCLWLMKKLLVTPLEQSKTIGDMYHVYVSKVQFEINHRPSKRLLRAINLIQEELQVLQLVNTWQTNLVRNYLEVLDDLTYEKIIPSRRTMHPYEDALGNACLDHLSLVRQDYSDLIRRCFPLPDRTKQILEINEEDHGKAIMVFTIVTVIFLPLSFVTSYFGMNASDIRDMNETQAVFWSVAIPLACVTVGSCLLVGYNGDSIRELLSSVYRKIMGKEKDTIEAAGITVSQRQGPSKSQGGLDSLLYSFGPANDGITRRPRGLNRAGHYFGPDYDEDEYDWWQEQDNSRLLDQDNTSTYPYGPYPSGITPRRQNSYPDPTSVAIQQRRHSLYPFSYPSERRQSRNDYDRVPYKAHKDVLRDYPPPPPPLPRKARAKSGYANSVNPISAINPFDPYSDRNSRSRLPDYGRSNIPYSIPREPRSPPRRKSTYDASARVHRGTYPNIDVDDSIFDRPLRREREFSPVRRDRSRSRSRGYVARGRSRSRSRSYDRGDVRHVHYEEKPAGRARYDSPDEYVVPYEANRAGDRIRGRMRQDYERLETGARRSSYSRDLY